MSDCVLLRFQQDFHLLLKLHVAVAAVERQLRLWEEEALLLLLLVLVVVGVVVVEE